MNRLVVVNVVGEMPQRNLRIAGILLAGGRSSRMGENKCFLEYKGKTLIDHMIDIIKKTSITDIYISGSIDGYQCLEDASADTYKGPAVAMGHIINTNYNHYDGFLFVPVDMPLLTSDILELLMSHECGAYFKDYPLPVFMPAQKIENVIGSVKNLLAGTSVESLAVPDKYSQMLLNCNTLQDWQEVLDHEHSH